MAEPGAPVPDEPATVQPALDARASDSEQEQSKKQEQRQGAGRERRLSAGQQAVAQAVARWNGIGSKVRVGLTTTNKFATLRDRYSINEVQPEQLKTVRRLGEGAFAVVEQAQYTRTPGAKPQTVAVKRLKPAVLNSQPELEAFLTECALTRKLKHKHVVEYIGVGTIDNNEEFPTVSSGLFSPTGASRFGPPPSPATPSRPTTSLFLVQEFMGGGTLKQLVSKQMAEPWQSQYTNRQALQWCIHIASALAYLHTANPVVIHRDLKMENILLSTDKQVAKLVDFGLCAFTRRMAGPRPSGRTTTTGNNLPSPKDQDELYTKLVLVRMRTSSRLGSGKHHWIRAFQVKELKAMDQLSTRTGTLMYMAPEMFQGQTYDEKVDVFSFGVIMYELFHRYITLCAISVRGVEEEVEAYAERVSNGYRPPLNDEAWPEAFRSLICDCWAQSPTDRPSMPQVVERLKEVAAKGLPEPPKAKPCGCF